MNINEIKAKEAVEDLFNQALYRLEHFSEGNLYTGTERGLREDVRIFIENSKLQEQYVTKLESDNEKLRKIVNILCDTISQLIE